MAIIDNCCHICYALDMATNQTTMNISLPEPMKQWVEQQMVSEGFGTASEYFRSLVREDQKRKAREELDQKLIEALNGGQPVAVDSEFWQKRRQELERRLKKSKRA